ncbi:hypothetical protein AT01_1339 [Yersinia aldovae 670-83]|nr:hypothetical protein AT01_1339 [Yersinia aldovae 670-83]
MMEKSNDTRNWRCFIGMHQWLEHSHRVHSEFAKERDKLPTRIYTIYTLKCVHCGEMTVRRI